MIKDCPYNMSLSYRQKTFVIQHFFIACAAAITKARSFYLKVMMNCFSAFSSGGHIKLLQKFTQTLKNCTVNVQLFSQREERHVCLCAASLQIANHSGYVQVDWKKVEKDVNKAKKHLKKKANKAAPEINTVIEEVKVSVAKLALLFLCHCQKKDDFVVKHFHRVCYFIGKSYCPCFFYSVFTTQQCHLVFR